MDRALPGRIEGEESEHQSVIMRLVGEFCELQKRSPNNSSWQMGACRAILEEVASRQATTLDEALAQVTLGNFVLELINEDLIEGENDLLRLARRLIHAAQPALRLHCSADLLHGDLALFIPPTPETQRRPG
ncbi:MAG: hypothetical protein OEO83_16235 [Alphaproteobacteria bacterium]|nr:hypothetical protein [Alphaproteobacteria bacterium]